MCWMIDGIMTNIADLHCHYAITFCNALSRNVSIVYVATSTGNSLPRPGLVIHQATVCGSEISVQVVYRPP